MALKKPIQMVFKTVMNSAYGKTIMKPVEHDTEYVSKLMVFISDFKKWIMYTFMAHPSGWDIKYT